VADGVTGILVEPGNTTELQAAIRRLDDDHRLRLAMGAAGRTRAEKFSAEVVTQLYEQHYRRLLAGQFKTALDFGAPNGEIYCECQD
jgi:glycogen synthase